MIRLFSAALFASFLTVGCATHHDETPAPTATETDDLSASTTACKVDADCVAIPAGGCCPNGLYVAVNKGKATAYTHAHECHEKKICPLYVIQETRVAECSTATHKCVMVHPEDIHCGGFIANAHQCPKGWTCDFAGHVPDVGGSCVKSCVQTQACMTTAHWDSVKCACVPNLSRDRVTCGTACDAVQTGRG